MELAMSDPSSFANWAAMTQRGVEIALDRALPAAGKLPARLHAAMRYACLGGGKRVRPLLCFASGSIFGAPEAAVEIAACATELIHVYSLVHDDLPAMDDDTLRRGKPTCHIAFDEATALLAGDALQTLAFEHLAQPLPGVPAERQLRMLHLLAEAAGSRGMAGGQAIDLGSVGMRLELAELEQMHIHKTGALIRASILLGAHCGEADDTALDHLTRFANRVGLLFQVVDDILDAESSTADLGKTAGKDQAANKPTYHTLLGSVQAKEFAHSLREDALLALRHFGDAAARLVQLTDFIASRRT